MVGAWRNQIYPVIVLNLPLNLSIVEHLRLRGFNCSLITNHPCIRNLLFPPINRNKRYLNPSTVFKSLIGRIKYRFISSRSPNMNEFFFQNFHCIHSYFLPLSLHSLPHFSFLIYDNKKVDNMSCISPIFQSNKLKENSYKYKFKKQK